MLEERGFQVLRNGWPDFLCVKAVNGTRGVMAVEVKAGSDKLSESQKLVHAILQAARIPVYVVRPHGNTQQLKTRQFLTHAEISGLREVIDQLERQKNRIVAEIEALRPYFTEANEVLKTATAVIDESPWEFSGYIKQTGIDNQRTDAASWRLTSD